MLVVSCKYSSLQNIYSEYLSLAGQLICYNSSLATEILSIYLLNTIIWLQKTRICSFRQQNGAISSTSTETKASDHLIRRKSLAADLLTVNTAAESRLFNWIESLIHELKKCVWLFYIFLFVNCLYVVINVQSWKQIIILLKKILQLFKCKILVYNYLFIFCFHEP